MGNNHCNLFRPRNGESDFGLSSERRRPGCLDWKRSYQAGLSSAILLCDRRGCHLFGLFILIFLSCICW